MIKINPARSLIMKLIMSNKNYLWQKATSNGVKEIKAKSIIVKSGLDVDYVINPYVGCLHSCIYCYARFMKRFTNHHEPWGKFVDIKINAVELIPKNTEKYKGRSIMISSVTDPYQPLERKYRKIYFTNNDYWNKIEKEIKDYGKKSNLNFKIYFKKLYN